MFEFVPDYSSPTLVCAALVTRPVCNLSKARLERLSPKVKIALRSWPSMMVSGTSVRFFVDFISILSILLWLELHNEYQLV